MALAIFIPVQFDNFKKPWHRAAWTMRVLFLPFMTEIFSADLYPARFRRRYYYAVGWPLAPEFL